MKRTSAFLGTIAIAILLVEDYYHIDHPHPSQQINTLMAIGIGAAAVLLLIAIIGRFTYRD